MEIRRLMYEDIGEDFLTTLAALRDTRLTVEEARRLYGTARSFHDWPQFGTVFVAADGPRIVGAGTLLVERKFIRQGGIVGHIEDVAVHPEWQGKGVGKLIVDALIGEARTVGCYKIILDCSADLVTFYGRFGFYTHDNAKHMRLDL